MPRKTIREKITETIDKVAEKIGTPSPSCTDCKFSGGAIPCSTCPCPQIDRVADFAPVEVAESPSAVAKRELAMAEARQEKASQELERALEEMSLAVDSVVEARVAKRRAGSDADVALNALASPCAKCHRDIGPTEQVYSLPSGSVLCYRCKRVTPV